MPGLDATGFTPKTFDEIKTDLENGLRSSISPNLNLGPTTELGALVAIVANEIADNWEAIESVYAAQYPSTGDGSSLDRLSELTGTIRAPATKSKVTATLNINDGITVPAGSIASVVGLPAVRFVTIDDAVGPGPGAQDVEVEMEGESTGPIAAPTGTLTVIETPVSGWNSITNAADAVLGTDTETDAALRLRRVEELARAGTGTVDAIRADVTDVDSVTSVRVFENTTDVVDGEGLPPHSFEVVALGGADQDIIDTIWDGKPAGIETSGTTSGTATDTQGDPHTVKFSRPTLEPVFVDVVVSKDPNIYPSDGDEQIKAALAAFVSAMDIGEDVIYVTLYDSIFSVSGVLDVTTLEIDLFSPPSGTVNLAIGNRELATLDTADITVVS